MSRAIRPEKGGGSVSDPGLQRAIGRRPAPESPRAAAPPFGIVRAKSIVLRGFQQQRAAGSQVRADSP
jgi:hypothetical protein